MIKKIIDSWKHIPYTWKHYLAIVALQYLYMGKVKYKFHDLDKLFLYIFCPWLGPEKIKKLHKSWSRHHKLGGSPEESLFDWECARYTKPDKPMNAWETCKTRKPEWMPVMYPWFVKYGLDEERLEE